MSNQDLINHLYDNISSLQTLYWETTGMLVTVIALVVGFYSYQQWKFSDSGIKNAPILNNGTDKPIRFMA